MAIDPLPERARLRAPPLRVAAGGDDPSPVALSALSVDCTEHSDLVLVALAGELDIYTTADFRERVRHYDPADVQMVIDLAEVSLLDAAGLGALVSLRNHASRCGSQLGVVCPSREMGRLLWTTGLRSAFVLGDDLAAVRAALPASREDPVE
jgi:anti-sigma B factor antagonist